MDEDPFDSDDFRQYADDVRANLIPKLRESAVVVSMVPLDVDALDVKLAVELGFSVMMDKPIIAVIEPGTRVPDKLVRIADAIVEADLSTPEGQLASMQALQEAVAKLGFPFGADGQDDE